MKNNCFKFILVLLFFFTTEAQTAPSNISLITLQCKADESICDTQEIVRYDFIKGEYVSKETILSINTDKGRFDFGNQIYLNRYIVSRSGSIFDIQTKQILGDNRGWLVDIIGKDIIYEVNNVNFEGIFAFDLNKKQYRKLPEKNVFELGGTLSPDKSRAAVWQNGLGKTKFQFYEILNWKSKKIKSVEGFFRANCSVRCSSQMKVPFVWLDNEKILTQKSNGEIITIDIKGKIEPIVTIIIDEYPDSLPYFEKDGYGNISYYCGGITYSINVKNKTFEKNNSILGNGFESIDGEVFWAEYFYKGKSIGRIWSSSPLTYKGFLVVDYAKEGKNLGYPDGIKIWNEIKQDWTTIEVNWGVKIIGWIENPQLQKPLV